MALASTPMILLASRFPIGRFMATPTAVKALPPADIETALRRHAVGDWGDVDEEDRRQNDLSLQQGLRLLSAYRATNGTKFWIITEADRSVTTVLLPEDY